jgi:DnaJ-class molecular chaperone
MRLAGKGMPSSYGSPGDMYLRIVVKPHSVFKRNRDDIHSDLKISYLDAILGKDIKVDTIHGPADIKVPAGTQPSSFLKIKNKGVNKKGHHFVKVDVKIPTSISDNERDLLLKLKDEQ